MDMRDSKLKQMCIKGGEMMAEPILVHDAREVASRDVA